MKQLFLFCFFSMLSTFSYSQSDTIYTKKQGKVICKITEIGENEIRYYSNNQPDGPVYVINTINIIKYVLSNGETQFIRKDELSLENEHELISGKNAVIKIHPFSLINHQISFAYEKVIKVGMNIDSELGYTNSEINRSGIFGNADTRNIYQGVYLKPGMKFFIGQDFSFKGLKYAHPLKGKYIKFDFAFCYLNYQNMVGYLYTGQYPNNVRQPIMTNSNLFSYGGFVNYGKQTILGNVLTLDYYVGFGYTGFAYNYTNPLYIENLKNKNFTGDNLTYTLSNFHGFLRVPNSGLSFTAGFRIGYILPVKKQSNNQAKNTTKGN